LAACGLGRSAFRCPFPLASTLRSFALSSSRPARHRVPLPKKEPFLRRLRVHRVACPPVVGAPKSGPCRHGFVHRVLDLRAFIHRRVRCRSRTFPPCPARCSHGLWIDSFRCLPRASFGGWRRPVWVVPPRRLQTASASIAIREWRGRQGLGLSGSARLDAGADPKVGGPPVQLACSPKTAALPVRPVRPEGRTRIGRVGVGRPEGRPQPRPVRTPKDSAVTPEEIPRVSPPTGPFHPKVLGLRLIASYSEEWVATQRSAPKGQAPVFERDPEASLPPTPEGAREAGHGNTPFVELARPPESGEEFRRATRGVTLSGAHRTLRRRPRRRSAARRATAHPKMGAAHGSGRAPASWR
jgi:hypothetical protein